MSIDGKAAELANEIINSNEFKEFYKVRSIVTKNKSYNSQIKTLQDMHLKIQTSSVENPKLQEQRINDFKKLYFELIKNEDMKKYLEAEVQFNEILTKSFKTINDKIQGSLK